MDSGPCREDNQDLQGFIALMSTRDLALASLESSINMLLKLDPVACKNWRGAMAR